MSHHRREKWGQASRLHILFFYFYFTFCEFVKPDPGSFPSGSFLYYSEDFDMYMAGSINQTESKMKPFRLMAEVIKAIQLKR